MSFQLKTEMKHLYFDRGRVMRRVSRGRRKALSRIGGYIRTTAARSMRSKKGSSPAGKPPAAHTKLLKRMIRYHYDEQRDSVVIGPVGFKGSNIPNVLEFGGTTEIRRRDGTREKVRIDARPFMGPAEQKTREKIPDAFRDLINTR